MTSSPAATKLSLDAVQRLVAAKSPINVRRMRRGQIGVIVDWGAAFEYVGTIVMRRVSPTAHDDLACILDDDWWPEYFDPQRRSSDLHPDEYMVVLVTGAVRAAVLTALQDPSSTRPKQKRSTKAVKPAEHLRPLEFDDD